MSVSLFHAYWRLFFLLFRFFAGKRKLRLEKNEKLLIVAPHPDDETLGVGALIADALQHKCDVMVIIVSDGAKSHDGCCKISREELISARRKCCIEAMRHLGLSADKIVFGPFEDGNLTKQQDEIFSWIKSIIGQGSCKIFVPADNEYWPDHLAIHNIGIRLIKQSNVSLFYYHVWSYLYGIYFKDILSLLHKHYYCTQTQDAYQRKFNAIQVYRESCAPCGKPFAGVLPQMLWRAVVQRGEYYCLTQEGK